LTAEETVEVGADLVALTLTESVALSATGLEEVGTLLGVTCLLGALTPQLGEIALWSITRASKTGTPLKQAHCPVCRISSAR